MQFSPLKRVISPLKRVNSFWFKLPVRYRGAVVTAIPAGCLLIALAAWIWSRQSLIAVRQQVEHVQQTMQEGNSLLIELLNAETGVRGFSTTRDPRFLEPYTQATNTFPTAQDQVNLMLQKDPQHNKELLKLQQLVQQNMQTLEQVIDVVRAEQETRSPPAQLNDLLDQDKVLMDSIRASLSGLQADQQQLLNEYLRQRADVQDRAGQTMWATVGISLLASIAALYLFRTLDHELQNRERMLRESKSLLQAIVTNVVDGVITLDEQGKIEIFNPAATELFGYEPTEVIGKDLGLLLVDPFMLNSSPEADQSADFPQIQVGRPWQTQGIRKMGAQFPVEISISDMNLDNRLIAIIRDITEFQQTELKLQARADELARLSAILAKTNAALEDRNRELEQFAYVASHDLKAPLRAIANLSEWLEEDLAGKLPEDNQHQMQLLRGRVHRMEALINGLLEYSRVGRTEDTTETVAIDSLLAEVIDSLDPPPSFEIAIQPGMPTLKTKRLLLRQVFANLIGNAIKHHDRQAGHINVSVQDQGQFYEFAVTDDGSGIAPEYHEKIFVIFQTLEARDVKESTGIGLSIVKKIVETEGGKITVESALGQGTTFRFTWPK